MSTTNINPVDINFEHRFWLRILRDHLTFIIDKLASVHVDELERANALKLVVLDQLDHVDSGVVVLSEVLAAVRAVRQFKVYLLRRQVVDGGDFKLSLPPTFINHMLNELDQYLRLLQTVEEGEVFQERVLNVHDLWLLDAAGHAESLMTELDPTEKDFKLLFKEQKKEFKMLHDKTKEFIAYVLRINTSFDAVERLTVLAIDEITAFNRLLAEVYNLRIEEQVLGTFSALLIDHMLREEAYYLMKLGIEVGDRPITDLIE